MTPIILSYRFKINRLYFYSANTVTIPDICYLTSFSFPFQKNKKVLFSKNKSNQYEFRPPSSSSVILTSGSLYNYITILISII